MINTVLLWLLIDYGIVEDPNSIVVSLVSIFSKKKKKELDPGGLLTVYVEQRKTTTTQSRLQPGGKRERGRWIAGKEVNICETLGKIGSFTGWLEQRDAPPLHIPQ